MYKALCRRVAGTEMPTDVTGRRSDAICLGDPTAVDLAINAAKAAPPAQPSEVARANAARGVPAVAYRRYFQR